MQLVLILSVTLSCNDILQVENQTAVDGERVFNDPALAELYLNHIYQNNLPGWSGTSNVGLSDESIGSSATMQGLLADPTSAQPDESLGNYSSDIYARIRNINVFITQVEDGDMDRDIKDSYIGQALFLRAWVYWGLVLDYGGVPIVTTLIDLNSDVSAELPRLSSAECVEILVNDLDKAVELLTDYGDSDFGRITKSAAAALKGRILLFFASPQFDPNGMSNADGIAGRWEAAYQANLSAKEIAESEGHALFSDFSSVFLTENNEEAIFIRKYALGLSTHTYENSVRPKSVSSTAPSATPSWDLAQSFPMKSGLAITDPGSGYDASAYWANRDPRFYATIGYNSIPWEFAGRADKRQWSYVGNSQEAGVIPITGFYLKKNVNTTITATQATNTPTDWIEIRFAEVLLNLAESANEAGHPDIAYQNLYAIRARAGIDAGDGSYGIASGLSKLQLREVIMNERKIEMAFENKRYWDIKRRNLYANGFDGVPLNGFNGTKRKLISTTVNTQYIVDNNAGLLAATNPLDSAFEYFQAELINTVDWDDPVNYANYFVTTVEDGDVVNINFLQPKYNFSYMPINALVKNSNLEQTIEWLDENGSLGTFDPLSD